MCLLVINIYVASGKYILLLMANVFAISVDYFGIYCKVHFVTDSKYNYSRHSSPNRNNQISGLVESILKSQLCPFFISYKNISLTRTRKNCNSRYVDFFSAKVLLTSKYTCSSQ